MKKTPDKKLERVKHQKLLNRIRSSEFDALDAQALWRLGLTSLFARLNYMLRNDMIAQIPGTSPQRYRKTPHPWQKELACRE